MSRILSALAILACLSGCKLEGVSRGPMVLVCTTPNGVETYRSKVSDFWSPWADGGWYSGDGEAYRQSAYESCGTRKVAE